MVADGGDAAFAQDHDQVGPADLGEAVGDDERSPAASGGGDGALDLVFGGRVDGAGRVIKDQDTRIGQEGTRDRQALALAAREGHAALAYDGLVALFELLDEILNLSRFCGGFDLEAGGVRFSEGDIIRDGTGEEEDILLDDRDLRAQRGQVPIAHIHAIDQDRPTGGVVGAVDQFD